MSLDPLIVKDKSASYFLWTPQTRWDQHIQRALKQNQKHFHFRNFCLCCFKSQADPLFWFVKAPNSYDLQRFAKRDTFGQHNCFDGNRIAWPQFSNLFCAHLSCTDNFWTSVRPPDSLSLCREPNHTPLNCFSVSTSLGLVEKEPPPPQISPSTAWSLGWRTDTETHMLVSLKTCPPRFNVFGIEIPESGQMAKRRGPNQKTTRMTHLRRENTPQHKSWPPVSVLMAQRQRPQQTQVPHNWQPLRRSRLLEWLWNKLKERTKDSRRKRT